MSRMEKGWAPRALVPMLRVGKRAPLAPWLMEENWVPRTPSLPSPPRVGVRQPMAGMRCRRGRRRGFRWCGHGGAGDAVAGNEDVGALDAADTGAVADGGGGASRRCCGLSADGGQQGVSSRGGRRPEERQYVPPLSA
ncbi:hypothetical protein PVAP13_6KG177206 [Panicum virgatum]|uniref:Uncharacterized protein n=1 Tax=Panicum virgatum TaxID=38727 RepID=A0A8T0RBV0_PANVG|nr:hypothetical protein PVAP13_6KG177206 [Panicum virgatum]